MTDDVGRAFQRWRASGERLALATVIAVEGSAPRGTGAKMLVTGGGDLAGSVSGGCVEGAVVEEALGVLGSGMPKTATFGIDRDMMWDVGLACGGEIEVFIESLERGTQPTFDEHDTLCTVVRGPDRVGERVIVRHEAAGTSRHGSTGSAALDEGIVAAAAAMPLSAAPKVVDVGEHEVFVDACAPPQRLIIVGAVHSGVALAQFAARAGFEVVVVDPREKFNNRERFPNASRLVVGWPEDELPALGVDQHTYVAVLSHDEKFDDPTLAHVLRRGARYVGAIGSRKTQAKRRARLAENGVTAEQIATLHGPIGLDIGADTPEEIAISVLAEMIAARHGHAGAPLTHTDRARIHER